MINVNLGGLAAAVARALRNFKYELTEDGRLFLTRERAFVGGVFRHSLNGGPMAVDPNRLVTEGLVYILNAALAGQSQTSQFYLAPFSGNVSPAADWKGSTFAQQATEFTQYVGTSRLPWTNTPATSTPSLGNAAALSGATMEFTGAGPHSVYGVGLLSAQAKSATTGVLVAATRFANPRLNMAAPDKLALEYTISAKDEGDA